MSILSASRWAVNAGLSLFLFGTLACSGPPPQDPKTFVVGIENAPTTLDPRIATDAYSSKICRLIYSGLFRLDKNLELIPDLLASYQVISSTEYLFTLKPNVRFHNGSRLTAEDVAWTYNSIRERRVVSPHYAVFSKIAAIEVVGEESLRITLKEPFAPFFAALTLGILPAPGGWREASEQREREGEAPAALPTGGGDVSPHDVGDRTRSVIGTGPFKLVEYVPEEKLVLQRFAAYYGGAPRPEQVIFRVIREDNLRVLELVRGRLDLIQNAVPAALIPYVKNQKDLSIDREKGINYTYMGFNLEDPHLKKLQVRQAIAHALDISKIISYKLQGLARPATGVLSPVHWAYIHPGIEYPYNPERARRLLDEAGLPDPDGPGPKPRFRFLYKTSSQRDRVGLARLIAHYLGAVGIEAVVTPYEWGTLFRDIRKGNFQLYSLTWVGVTEPDIYYYIFHSSQVPPQGGNRNRYRNSAVDQLTAAGRVTLDRRERQEIYAETQKIVAHELPYLSLWYEDNVVVRRKDVQGYDIYPNASFMGLVNIYRVTLAQ